MRNFSFLNVGKFSRPAVKSILEDVSTVNGDENWGVKKLHISWMKRVCWMKDVNKMLFNNIFEDVSNSTRAVKSTSEHWDLIKMIEIKKYCSTTFLEISHVHDDYLHFSGSAGLKWFAVTQQKNQASIYRGITSNKNEELKDINWNLFFTIDQNEKFK